MEMDKGPWKVMREKSTKTGKMDYFLASDDFTHDVFLIISGDFASPKQKRKYAQQLADKLNGGTGSTPKKKKAAARTIPEKQADNIIALLLHDMTTPLMKRTVVTMHIPSPATAHMASPKHHPTKGKTRKGEKKWR